MRYIIKVISESREDGSTRVFFYGPFDDFSGAHEHLIARGWRLKSAAFVNDGCLYRDTASFVPYPSDSELKPPGEIDCGLVR